MLKVNSRNTRTRCEICSKLTIKISERRHWRRSDIFIVNFEHISHLVLVFLMLALNMLTLKTLNCTQPWKHPKDKISLPVILRNSRRPCCLDTHTWSMENFGIVIIILRCKYIKRWKSLSASALTGYQNSSNMAGQQLRYLLEKFLEKISSKLSNSFLCSKAVVRRC